MRPAQHLQPLENHDGKIFGSFFTFTYKTGIRINLFETFIRAYKSADFSPHILFKDTCKQKERQQHTEKTLIFVFLIRRGKVTFQSAQAVRTQFVTHFILAIDDLRTSLFK